ncbi:hypothetical protein, partial [Pectobacterium sp. B1J-3]|uniref:hypothetical protein n=1 Tax=Pectobacterium sp. B1J-3 TaxID=3385371 RepID=UPI003905CE37
MGRHLHRLTIQGGRRGADIGGVNLPTQGKAQRGGIVHRLAQRNLKARRAAFIHLARVAHRQHRHIGARVRLGRIGAVQIDNGRAAAVGNARRQRGAAGGLSAQGGVQAKVLPALEHAVIHGRHAHHQSAGGARRYRQAVAAVCMGRHYHRLPVQGGRRRTNIPRINLPAQGKAQRGGVIHRLAQRYVKARRAAFIHLARVAHRQHRHIGAGVRLGWIGAVQIDNGRAAAVGNARRQRGAAGGLSAQGGVQAKVLPALEHAVIHGRHAHHQSAGGARRYRQAVAAVRMGRHLHRLTIQGGRRGADIGGVNLPTQGKAQRGGIVHRLAQRNLKARRAAFIHLARVAHRQHRHIGTRVRVARIGAVQIDNGRTAAVGNARRQRGAAGGIATQGGVQAKVLPALEHAVIHGRHAHHQSAGGARRYRQAVAAVRMGRHLHRLTIQGGRRGADIGGVNLPAQGKAQRGGVIDRLAQRNLKARRAAFIHLARVAHRQHRHVRARVRLGRIGAVQIDNGRRAAVGNARRQRGAAGGTATQGGVQAKVLPAFKHAVVHGWHAHHQSAGGPGRYRNAIAAVVVPGHAHGFTVDRRRRGTDIIRVNLSAQRKRQRGGVVHRLAQRNLKARRAAFVDLTRVAHRQHRHIGTRIWVSRIGAVQIDNGRRAAVGNARRQRGAAGGIATQGGVQAKVLPALEHAVIHGRHAHHQSAGGARRYRQAVAAVRM